MKTRSLISTFMVAVFFSCVADLQAQTAESQTFPQFVFPTFSRGIIKMKDGRKMTAVLNYNSLDEEMIFLQGNRYMVLDKPEEIDTVYIQNRRFVYTGKVFYEVVASGKYTLFIQHKSKYSERGSTTAYGMTTKTAQTYNITSVQGGGMIRHPELPANAIITPAPIFWAEIGGEKHKFLNEKQLLKLIPDRAAELKQFIKSSGIDIKTVEGLWKVGNFLNGTVQK